MPAIDHAIALGLSYDDVLLVPRYSRIRSRREVDLATTIAPGIGLRTPLVAVNMDTVTGVEMAIAMDRLGGIGLIGRFDPPAEQAAKVRAVTAAGARCIGVIGVKDDALVRAEQLLAAGSAALHLDIAHAHSAHAIETIAACKRRWPAVPFIAGTIATHEAALDLYEAGADALKVGIGAGSICITRITTGAGVPQITAIAEVARARAERYPDRFVLADGGAANAGDIVKALAAGADAYLGGSLFAGTDEAPGELVEVAGGRFKHYNGSTSPDEKRRQVANYEAFKDDHYALHVEGVNAMVPARGPVAAVVAALCAGIRSGLSYCGAFSIPELHERARFVRITPAGHRESQPHDVTVRD
ncbi:MAG: guanosine monophosphate reductase [Chloroflexia bacterium]|nr:guanosine monophosphate reductase [Chloroflexia bacterium]